MHNSMLAFALAAIPAAFATTYDVTVGAGGKNVYHPEYVNAHIGDIVNFTFHPKNHTVTQSVFDAPCVPVAGGFNSGFMPVASEYGPLPTFQIHVKDDKHPIWIHCQQKGHCGQGMVFAVNPPSDHDPKSLKAFRDRAIAINGTASSSSAATATATTSYASSYDTHKSYDAKPAPAHATNSYAPPPPHWEKTTATASGVKYTPTESHYESKPAPTHAADFKPIDHKIIVGPDGKLLYNPANITAAVGDTVTFEFRPKNHTVTQSSFDKPCEPLVDYKTGAVGFKSGFRPVAPDATTFPQFQIKINDTAPIWGYCGQVNHCSAGMVFSINANEHGPKNFAAFQARAKGTAANTSASATSSSVAKTQVYMHRSRATALPVQL